MDREHQLDVKIMALAEELRALTLLVEELRERLRSVERRTVGTPSP